MQRRTFLQASGLLTLSPFTFPALSILPLQPQSRYLQKTTFTDMALDLTPLDPNKVPQIIAIFLYGGPSELAGNLTNIEQIMLDSQTPYPVNFNNQITPNQFWREAGGQPMEALLKAKQMSIYRTINRIQEDDNKAHGRSVIQNLAGNSTLGHPGIATVLAHILERNNPFNKSLEQLNFPIISFEGTSLVFNQNLEPIHSALKPIALNANLNDPYTHHPNSALINHNSAKQQLDTLALSMLTKNTRFPAINEAFAKRAQLAETLQRFLSPQAVEEKINLYNQSLTQDQKIQYNDDNFGIRLKAATSLALANPETVFISLGSGGLGGWDDHSGALNVFQQRMNKLMQAISTAMQHIQSAKLAGVPNAGNIIINVFGDFGRNTNINSAKGWDHGNNQNLYTFGGENIRGQMALGKIIGTTQKIGPPKDNRQYTTPAPNSYQCTPYAIAASLYRYFGVQNPEQLTGVAPIDESVTSETVL